MTVIEPQCLALVLCERYAQDPHTGKYDLLGVFDAFAVSAVPVELRFAVYVALADGLGTMRLSMIFKDHDGNELSSAHADNLTFARRGQFVDRAVHVRVPVRASGRCVCELRANDNSLLERPFHVATTSAHG